LHFGGEPLPTACSKYGGPARYCTLFFASKNPTNYPNQ
jgi:hypothetical protein